jgi:hypothetical protein
MNTYRLYCDDGFEWLVQAPSSGAAILRAERALGRRVGSWEVSTGRTTRDRDLPKSFADAVDREQLGAAAMEDALGIS